MPCETSCRYERGQSVGLGWRGNDKSGLRGRPALTVLNGCLKRYKGVQICDKSQMPGMMAKWPFSRGIRERAWGESNTRPAA